MLNIRLLTEVDAEALWQLRLIALESEPQAFAESAAHHRATPQDRYRERLRSDALNSPVFGAFDEDCLVGMVGIYLEQPEAERNGHVWGTFLLPSYRGAGLGLALMGALLQYARTVQKLRSVRLEVASTQAAARRLYVSYGFCSLGCREDGMEQMILQLSA